MNLTLNYMQTIIRNGLSIIHDECDCSLLNELTIWLKGGIVVCSKPNERTSYTLGRTLLNLSESDLDVDHKDRDKFNFSRDNLRIITHQQNCMNKGPYKGGASKYKGVFFFKRNSKWQVSITCNGRKYHLGFFKDEVEAAKAYDAKARELHGEFAYQNFMI